MVSQFGEDINKSSNLHLVIPASICNVRTMNLKDIIKAVVANGSDLTNESKISMLTYNASDTFWSLVNKATGYIRDNVANIDEMSIHIVLSTLTKIMQEKNFLA